MVQRSRFFLFTSRYHKIQARISIIIIIIIFNRRTHLLPTSYQFAIQMNNLQVSLPSLLRWVYLATLLNIGVSNTNVANDIHQTIYSENGRLETTLAIGEALYENPTTGLKQRMIGYNGIIGGPTLHLQPGDNLVLTLKNDLPPEPCNTFVPELFNQYHGVDITNLHFHGLHISEALNPIHLELRPGQNYTYNIRIPEGHSGGTFW